MLSFQYVESEWEKLFECLLFPKKKPPPTLLPLFQDKLDSRRLWISEWCNENIFLFLFFLGYLLHLFEIFFMFTLINFYLSF